MRASDQDREAAVRVLCEAYAAGRLDLNEIRDRSAAAYCARTWGDLRWVTPDIPWLPGAWVWPAGGPPPRPGAGRHRARPVVPVLLIALAWLAVAAADYMPLAGAPLAALPLAIMSMAALFAAGRLATRRPDDTMAGRRVPGFP
jgi:DUF1707 SHOCT-like domain